jgi:hypothetical protein
VLSLNISSEIFTHLKFAFINNYIQWWASPSGQRAKHAYNVGSKQSPQLNNGRERASAAVILRLGS